MLVTVVASPAVAGCRSAVASVKRGLTPLLHLPGTGRRRSAKGKGLSDATLARTPRSWALAICLHIYGQDVAPFLIKDGDQLDAGYAQWHSDETEIMNSSRDPRRATSASAHGREPATGPS
jgi:hypothetical protein